MTRPCDLGIYDAPLTGLTKNDRFEEMLVKAKKRGTSPLCLFVTWYCSIYNLALVTKIGWYFLTRLKSNRIISFKDGRNIPISDAPNQRVAEPYTSRSTGQ
ncbi:MAG: hypothetical protein KGI02_08000 [Thaumarchaeota archaeon]|nr:hypothetical protein [Nitrososphaerota archaeon]MDE1832294.1 hypothetical protein [Nitrososphaerota archaeon]MDE1841432.1 hypothetical protein [Nitrososphaerota archaeon]MDE1878630.1 hypothetical protein [Nitrososphaerota archaeon]